MNRRPETRRVTTDTDTCIRAERDDVQRLIDVLQPLTGGIWLATDMTTLFHWTISAHSVALVEADPNGRVCRAFGLATICTADAQPVFLINERDSLEWIEPGEVLAVRDLGDRSCEIRLERLDDLDARLIAAFDIQKQGQANPALRVLSVGNCQYLQIYDEQLPTGDPAADGELQTIEDTIEARRTLYGPSAGTLDVLKQMERQLDATARKYAIGSHVWAAVLRERIAGLRESLAA